MTKFATPLIGLLLLGGPAPAQPPTSPDNRDAIVCQLLGNCPDAPKGDARVGASRSFSFTRTTDTAKGAKKRKAATAARRGRPELRAAAPVTAIPGQYDLRVTFVSGSDVVSSESRQRIRDFAAALDDPRLAQRRVLIEGHTDAIGDPAANLDLSRRRARAVAELVAGNGVDLARLDVEGYGATRPLPGVPATAAPNRRVVASLIK